MLPAARGLNGFAPPDASRSIEIEETSRMIPAAMLHDEVPIQNHGFHLRQVVVVPVEVSPASLDHPDLGVSELVDGLVQELRVWNEIGVEDGNELASGDLQASLQRPRFESEAIVSMQIVDIDALPAQCVNRLASHVLGFVRGIVEELDLQKLWRVVDFRHRLDQSFNNEHLVVDRELNCNRGQRLESPWLGYTLLVSQIQVHQLIAVQTVDRQDDQDGEVRDENEHIKSIQDVMLSRLVEEIFIGT